MTTGDGTLDALYEGQLDAVLDAWRDVELKRLRYTSPLRLDPTADHACHGCALDPTKHPIIEDWHGKAGASA